MSKKEIATEQNKSIHSIWAEPIGVFVRHKKISNVIQRWGKV